MKVDYIIIGQGLAGSLLCWELHKRGADVLVYDTQKITKASEVAAGLINPVVFRRMTKSWLIDVLYPQLLNFILKRAWKGISSRKLNCKLWIYLNP